MTGETLGCKALPVETISSPGQFPRWKQMLGQKPKGVVIYVCCQDCVAKVKSEPAGYLYKVIAQRNGWQKQSSN